MATAAGSRAAGGTRVGGVAVTNPGRVIDRTSGLTKLALVRHYEQVAPRMLAELKGRPVALLRAPSGIGGAVFFQRHDDKRAPDAPVQVATSRALLQAAQLNTIEFHVEGARVGSAIKPDRIVFDLDPGEGVEFAAVRRAARDLRALLQQLELRAWLKTSGGKGLHLVLPIAARWSVAVVKGLAKAVVERMAAAQPDRIVAKSGAANRVGRIFIDYLRNGPEAMTVAAYSARARPGLGVSMPLAWDELEGIGSGSHFTVADAAAHLRAQAADPWADFGAARQSIASALKALKLRAPPRPARRVP